MFVLNLRNLIEIVEAMEELKTAMLVAVKSFS